MKAIFSILKKEQMHCRFEHQPANGEMRETSFPSFWFPALLCIQRITKNTGGIKEKLYEEKQ